MASSIKTTVKKFLLRFVKNEKGQSLVEFALVLIIFMVIFLAITEFGRAWYRLDSLKNAANIAARTYAVQPSESAACTEAQKVISTLVCGTSITFAPVLANRTSVVTVTVSELFNAAVPFFPMIGQQFGGTSGRTLSRSATYRIEQ